MNDLRNRLPGEHEWTLRLEAAPLNENLHPGLIDVDMGTG